MPDTHPLDLDACDLSTALHERRLSCRELMQACLDRIGARNPAVNAIVSLRPAEALLAEAGERDAELARGASRGWLHGVPIAVKDTTATAGLRTTFGSPLFAEHVPAHDAIVVERMKGAGAIVIGKTNVPEFGLGSHSYNPVFGVTRNAWDAGRCAGGSSGGAATALALRMLPVADGSDVMGSLRNPAAFGNVFGLRPSTGRVPAGPPGELYVSQLYTEGPMARRVRDLARLLSVQAGHDPRAPLSIAEDGTAFARPLDGHARGLVVGWLGDLNGQLPMERGILDVCGEALGRLEHLGAVVEPVALGHAPEALWRCWLTLRAWLNAARLGPHHADPAERARLKPEACWEVKQGLGLSAADVYRASVERSAFHQRLLRLFERVDLLALPTAQVWPFDVALDWPKAIEGVAMDTYHRWMEVTVYATLAGLPAISVPAGFDARGLPMGLQLIGPPHADLALLQAAAAYESTIGELLARRPAAAA